MINKAMTGCRALLCMSLILCGVSSLHAANITWDNGGATNNWNEADNWSAGVPGTGDQALFSSNAPAGPQTINLSADQPVFYVQMQADATDDYTIVSSNGSVLQPGSGSGAGRIIQNSDSQVLTFDVDIDAQGQIDFTGSGASDVIFNGVYSITNPASVGISYRFVNGRAIFNNDVTLTNQIYFGIGDVNTEMILNHDGVMSSVSNFQIRGTATTHTINLGANAGVIDLSNGSFADTAFVFRLTDEINPDTADDSATFTVSNNIGVNAGAGASVTLAPNAGGATGGVTLRLLNTGTGTRVIDVPIATTAGSTVLIETTNAAGVVQLRDRTNTDANITGTGQLRKTGPGTLQLQVAQSYSGGTLLEGGTIVYTTAAASMPDSGTIAMTAGTTLNLNNTNDTIGGISGNGTVNIGTATLTIAEGVSPGNSVGTLVINGDGLVLLDAGSDSLFEINRLTGTNDLVILADNADLTIAGTITIASATGIKIVPSEYTLFQLNGSGTADISGASLVTPQWMTGSLLLGGDGNEVILSVTAVPEPASVALMALGMGVIFKRRGRSGSRAQA